MTNARHAYVRPVSVKQTSLALEFKASREIKTVRNLPGIYLMNLILGGLVILCLLAYIFIANFLVSQRYLLETLRRQLSQASTELEQRNSEIENGYNLEQLTVFARTLGMTEAKETDSVFEDNGVALFGIGH